SDAARPKKSYASNTRASDRGHNGGRQAKSQVQYVQLSSAPAGGCPMSLEVEAIYQNGGLKLAHELPLQEGQKVKVTIHSTTGAVDRLYGMLKWNGSKEELDYLLGPDNHPWAREE